MDKILYLSNYGRITKSKRGYAVYLGQKKIAKDICLKDAIMLFLALTKPYMAQKKELSL
ncbi:MAG TPA: hypothetical protein VIL24_02400 [Clostridia bacterium]